jgi:hypothetical protein
MKTFLVTAATAFALAALAGCDRNPEQQRPGTTPPAQAGAGATGSQSSTPTTPANVGTPSEAEKREGSNPVQGQVDPKHRPQHKDFQQRGDGAGPKQ